MLVSLVRHSAKTVGLVSMRPRRHSLAPHARQGTSIPTKSRGRAPSVQLASRRNLLWSVKPVQVDIGRMVEPTVAMVALLGSSLQPGMQHAKIVALENTLKATRMHARCAVRARRSGPTKSVATIVLSASTRAPRLWIFVLRHKSVIILTTGHSKSHVDLARTRTRQVRTAASNARVKIRSRTLLARPTAKHAKEESLLTQILVAPNATSISSLATRVAGMQRCPPHQCRQSSSHLQLVLSMETSRSTGLADPVL